MVPMHKKAKKAFNVALVLAFLFSVATILQPNNFILRDYIQPSIVSASHLASMSSSAGWNQRYGGADWDSAEAVIQTSDGGYALAGSTRSFSAGWEDFWLVKTDSLGNMEWDRTYGGEGRDFAESIVQTSDGGYAIAGYTGSGAWLVKTDSVGNMQWNRTYEGNSAFSVIQTSDGGYALAGSIADDFWLVKTDALGYVQWNKTYGGEGNDAAQSVVQTRDGGYALVGITRLGTSEGDFLLVKTDSTGNMEWSQIYGSEDKDEGHCVVQTGDGGYAVSGLMWNRSGNGSAGVIKTDSVGNIQWKRNYDGGTAWSVALTSEGGYIIACSKLVKIDSEGNEQWTKTLDGNAHSVIQTNDGGYAIAGAIANGESYDFWLVKTDSEGNYNPSTAEPTTTPSTQEPFPTTLVIASAIIVAFVAIALLVYFKKRKH
jgi:hypothetical protein